MAHCCDDYCRSYGCANAVYWRRKEQRKRSKKKRSKKKSARKTH